MKLKRIYLELPPNTSLEELGIDMMGAFLLGSLLGEFAEMIPELLCETQQYNGEDEAANINKGDQIEFLEDAISVEELGEKNKFLLERIMNLKIFFVDDMNYTKNKAVHPGFVSRIEFKLDSSPFQFHYYSSKKNIRTLCETLYNKRLRFKEYYNGKRVFLGRQPKYAEVQILKKKYMIDW